MKDLKIKDIFVLVLIVVAFVVLLIESSKIGKNIKISDYANFDSKYTGATNQINYIKVTESDIVQKYLADFVNTVQTNREEAYKLIDDYYKEKTFSSISDFNRKMDIISSKLFLDATVISYSVKYDNKTKYFFIKDAAGNIFVFKEKNIMDYTVYLDTTSIDL